MVASQTRDTLVFEKDKRGVDLRLIVSRVTASNDIAEVFTIVPELAGVPVQEYITYKALLKEHFGRRLIIKDLDRVVSDARKSRKWVQLQEKKNSKNKGDRPVIEVNRQLREVMHDTLEVLASVNARNPTIFVQSGKLVTIYFDEKNGPSIVSLTESALRYHVTKHADFVTMRATVEDVRAIPVEPPFHVIQDILNGINPIDYPFPALIGITELPIMREDGSLHLEPGYDHITKYVYIPGGLVIPALPDIPTEDDVKRAKELLDFLLCDFPFVDAASKATVIADLVTVVIRTFINSVSPLTLLDAPKQGTGKTLLAQLIGLIASGIVPGTYAPTDDNEEWRKRVITWLQSSPSVVIIDNVYHKLESESLSQALTTTSISDRILATQNKITVTNNAVWFASGNNIQVGDDLARRCIKCRLDAKMVRPQERTGFHIPGGVEGLFSWVREHRAEIVHALLILVKNWFAKNRPEPTIIPLGNFERWTTIVGGILETAHIDGFLQNLRDEHGNSNMDGVIAEWTAFIDMVYSQYKEQPFTCASLARAMIGTSDESQDLRELIPSSVIKNFDNYRRSEGTDMQFPLHMGHTFRSRKGQIFESEMHHATLCLEVSPIKASGNKVQWKITKSGTDESTPASVAEPPEQKARQFIRTLSTKEGCTLAIIDGKLSISGLKDRTKEERKRIENLIKQHSRKVLLSILTEENAASVAEPPEREVF